MKSLLLAFMLLPIAALAQCDNIIGGAPAVAMAYVNAAKTYLQTPLQTIADQPTLLRLSDSSGRSSITINYASAADTAAITALYISGPWERIEKFYTDYVLPRTPCGQDVRETVREWNGQKVVHMQQGKAGAVPLGFIRFEAGKM